MITPRVCLMTIIPWIALLQLRPTGAFLPESSSLSLTKISSNKLYWYRRRQHPYSLHVPSFERKGSKRIRVNSPPKSLTWSLRTLPNEHLQDDDNDNDAQSVASNNHPLDPNGGLEDNIQEPEIVCQQLQEDELMAMPISALLSLLIQNDIRISPTATRQELVQLLLQKYQSMKDENENKVTKNSCAVDENHLQMDPKLQNPSETDNVTSTVDLNKQVNKRTPYSRGRVTRRRDIPSKSQTRTSTRREDMEGMARRRMRRKRQERDGFLPGDSRLDWDGAVENILPSVQAAEKWGRKVASNVNRAAKLASNNLGKRVNKLKISRGGYEDVYGNDDDDDDNNDGPKEVDWYYVSRNEMETRPRKREAVPRKRRPSPPSNPSFIGNVNRAKVQDNDARKGMYRNNIPVQTGMGDNGSDNQELLALPQTLEGVVYFPNPNSLERESRSDPVMDGDNPDAIPRVMDSNNVEQKTSPSKVVDNVSNQQIPRVIPRRKSIRQNRSASNSTKKIYSVYPQKESDENYIDLEELYGRATARAIDTVGEFLADVISGESTTFENRTAVYTNDKTKNNTSTQYSPRQQRTKSSLKRRYWKDRLAEKVDYALGVHEDGGYYKSWQDQLDRDRERESSTRDPISIFYGNQKKRRKDKKTTGPFWEEDGSLMSLLLGRNPKGRELTYNKLFERDFSLNILLKTAFKSVLAVLSYVCRWASCRGALPQPIVVFVFAASALSAPKRKKVMAAVLALIVTRAVAEAIHGYVYGNEDWEDDDLVDTSEKDTR